MLCLLIGKQSARSSGQTEDEIEVSSVRVQSIRAQRQTGQPCQGKVDSWFGVWDVAKKVDGSGIRIRWAVNRTSRA